MFKSLMKLFGGSSSPAESAKSGSSAVATAPGKAEKGSVKELECFVDYVVKALVDSPADVKITTSVTDGNNVITISCKKEDIGKIVGKHGKTIMAIRSLVNGAAGRLQQKVSVEVLD